MNTSCIANSVVRRQWLRSSCIVFAVAAASLMFGAATANASCGVLGNQRQEHSMKSAAFVTARVADAQPRPKRASVIGFWHVKLIKNDGSLFFQSIVQYHVGGLEMESAGLDPSGGNFCMGVWKQKGRTVTVYHVSLGFQGGVPFAYGVFRYTNTLSKDGNSYRGHFDLKEYDIHTGEFLGVEVKGTTVAHRIDFDHPFKVF